MRAIIIWRPAAIAKACQNPTILLKPNPKKVEIIDVITRDKSMFIILLVYPNLPRLQAQFG